MRTLTVSLVGLLLTVIAVGCASKTSRHAMATSALPHASATISPNRRPNHAIITHDDHYGKTYHARLPMILDSDVWGPQLERSLTEFCVGVRNMRSHQNATVPSFSQMHAIDPGYDEIRQGTLVRVIDGPNRDRCIGLLWYRVSVLGVARGGDSSGWMMASSLVDRSQTNEALERLGRALQNAHQEQLASNRREPYHEYWERVLVSLGKANAALRLTGAFLQRNDTSDAHQLLQGGEGMAEEAEQQSREDIPSGWSSISGKLGMGAALFKEALAGELDSMNTGDSSDAADALSSAERSNLLIRQATIEARAAYVTMGGRTTDLDDLDSATQNYINSLH